MPLFLGGVASGLVGVVFFILPGDTTSLLHSHWHVFISLGLLLVQEAVYKPSVNPYARTETPASLRTPQETATSMLMVPLRLK